jgi:hypothetical protein
MLVALLIAAGLCFVAAMAGCWIANATIAMMADELNRGRPLAEHVDALGWPPGKSWRIFDAYSRAFPGASRLSRFRWAVVAMVLGLLSCFAFLAAAGPALGGPYGRAAVRPPPNESLQLTEPRNAP